MKAQLGGLTLVLLCSLFVHTGCTRDRPVGMGSYPTAFLWDEPLVGSSEQLGAQFGEAVAGQLARATVRSQVERAREVARDIAEGGVVRSYRIEWVLVGGEPGYAFQWYVRTGRGGVLIHGQSRKIERLVNRGIPTMVVLFLDEATARAFEERLASADVESLVSAEGFSTADVHTFISVQEGKSTRAVHIHNLESDQRGRQALLANGDATVRAFVEHTESAAVIDRAFTWLRRHLESETGGISAR